MSKTLSHLLKELVEKKTQALTGVENIHGTLADIPVTETITKVSDWQLYELGGSDMLSPDEILNRLSAVKFFTAPITRAQDGVLTVTTTVTGVHLLTTFIAAPSPFSLAIQVEAAGNQIALYSNETVIRRASDRLTSSMSMQAGLTPLNIVVFGPPTGITVTLPEDVTTSILPYIPTPPEWRDSFPVETNYIDPKSGNTGNALYWNNQERVGGWGVYQVDSGTYGMVTRAFLEDGRMYIETNYSGEPTTPIIVRVEDYIIGVASKARYDGDIPEIGPRLDLQIDIAASEVDPLDIISGTLQGVTFRHLHDFIKTGGEETLTFVDTDVKAGNYYSYTLDAFSAFDKSIRSDKAEIQTVQAGDIWAPESVTIIGAANVLGVLTITYLPPDDEDYAGTHVYYDNVDSGTLDSVILDFGLPSLQDSVTFTPIDSGTYYLASFDQVGNEQHIQSGATFDWDGVIGAVDINQPPVIEVRQLTRSETETDGFNPSVYARYELDASDPNDPVGDLTLYYRRGDDGSWSSIGGGSLPFKVNLRKGLNDNWLRVYVTDGDLNSDTLTFVADYDNIPEVVGVDTRQIINSGTVYATGTVDDDTRSLEWYITTDYTGPTGSDPTVGSPDSVDNTEETKIFNFTFDLTDGQKKVLHIDPYSYFSGTGEIGAAYETTLERPPRTISSIIERTVGGEIKRTEAAVTLKASPETALIYKKVIPLTWGTVTSATSTTLSDTDQNWPVDKWNDYYSVKIIAGTGEGQERVITDTTATQITITPSWSPTPDTTSEYEVGEIYRLYGDTGTVSSSTATTLVDSSKTWDTNQFATKTVRVISATGGKQYRKIESNTSTELTIPTNTPWGSNPSNGDAYKIFGPEVIVKNVAQDKTLWFYSEVPGITTEQEQSLIIDSDTTPEIGELLLTEPEPGELVLTISSYDDDVKNWAAYARKNNFPTFNDVESGTLDPVFLRFFGSKDTVSLTLNVDSGTWYAAAKPYDSYSNPGPTVWNSYLIVGSGEEQSGPGGAPANPSITDFYSYARDNLPDTYNLIVYEHNSTAEDPAIGSPGHCTVKLFARRLDVGIDVEITQPATRYTWQDPEDGADFVNEVYTSETANTYGGRGALFHSVERANRGGDPWGDDPEEYVYTAYKYTLDLYSGTTLIDTYVHTGDYGWYYIAPV
ncbi:MAG: hypothetical protein ACW99Q_00420 [Candidatus Kariarchaeaceae archaeon]|jgi:hypothetical protein